MIIREPSLDDVNELIPLFFELYEEGGANKYGAKLNYHTIRNSIYDLVKNQVGFLLLDNDKIVGFIFGVIQISPMDRNQTVMFELNWYVRQEHRSRSVTLLNRLEKHCKDEGIGHLIVGNTDMGKSEKFKKFYERKGFKLFEMQFLKEI